MYRIGLKALAKIMNLRVGMSVNLAMENHLIFPMRKCQMAILFYMRFGKHRPMK